MILSEQLILEFRMGLEELVTEREMMIARNKKREFTGHAPAYGENAFYNIQQRMEALRIKLIKLGEKQE